MIRSMTAFARQEQQGEWGDLVWEIRSINHRFLDISLRLPDDFRQLEPRIREQITSRISRGKVECNLRFQPHRDVNTVIPINIELANQVIQACKTIDGLLYSSSPTNAVDILKWPGVLEVDEPDIKAIREQAMALLDKALTDLVESRQREGAKLAEVIKQRCDAMLPIVMQVKSRLPEVHSAIREKLLNRLEDLKITIDPTRLEQELVITAQKLDVTEELDRLVAHIEEVNRLLEQDEPVGRRLDFLMQELNREANTLGSKSADIETTRASVDLKVYIEQMREQIQNME